MLTLPRKLPLHTIDLLSWDFGLPRDYRCSILRRYRDHFDLEQSDGDERIWLRLLSWDDSLAVSELEKSADGGDTSCLSFPVSFTRGFWPEKQVHVLASGVAGAAVYQSIH
jgi:hypothetical protein